METFLAIAAFIFIFYPVSIVLYQNYIVSKLELINAQVINKVINNSQTVDKKYLSSLLLAQAAIIDNIKVISIWNIITRSIQTKEKSTASNFKKELDNNLPNEIKILNESFVHTMIQYTKANAILNILPLTMLFMLSFIIRMTEKLLKQQKNFFKGKTPIKKYDLKQATHLNEELSLIFAPNTRNKIIKNSNAELCF